MGNIMPKDKKTDYSNEVENIIKSGREKIQKSNENRENLLEEIAGSFADLGLGVNTIQIGDEKFNLKYQNNKISSAEQEYDYFTQLLNSGSPLFILTVHNDFTSYAGKEKALFKKQKLENLIDKELVEQLAPTARIYAPKDKKPWNNILERESFEIFISDYQELVSLWENMKRWVKLDWHDDITKKQKYFHKAEDVFMIEVFHSFAPDLSWRYAQFKNAEKKAEKVNEKSEWDTYSQRELKNAITSLLNLERHPVFGKNVSKIIKEIKPMLAQSMEGKKLAEQTGKERYKAEVHLNKGYKFEQVDWSEWTKKVPIENPSNSKSKKKK
jgi:hypothetical protein